MTNNEVKCSKCDREWVPNFSIDCYEIDGVQLCEPCAMPIFMEACNPSPIDDNRLTNVCKIGQGGKTCKFIGVGGNVPGYVCLKHTPMAAAIKDKSQNGSMGAKGDNCSGPPAFRIL